MNTAQQRLTTRGQIIALREEGFTVRAIADRLTVSISIVKRWIWRYAETSILTDLGIVPPIKERLTEQHRTGRLLFAQQYVGEDLEFWSRVVFADEKTFASTNHGKIHLWRPNRTSWGSQPAAAAASQPPHRSCQWSQTDLVRLCHLPVFSSAPGWEDVATSLHHSSCTLPQTTLKYTFIAFFLDGLLCICDVSWKYSISPELTRRMDEGESVGMAPTVNMQAEVCQGRCHGTTVA
ncbi:putative Transposable element Tc1 transposase-like 51 [Homarus americanus]|uniref:Putative Transposable element Tc1 transposase-like 51 n=1 Tax=Homarus americanus TaxID=6706 RepID=A0A8J5K4G3_HOMAM|nr:putative Transposable element Tc1 transposase-like 51 [Homarus americanus]